MKNKSILTLIFLALLTLSSCGNTTPTQLGTSDYTIILPNGYVSVEDNFDEDQVAYFYKDDNSIDFDVYQWEKGNEYTLEDEANYFASEYGTVAEPITINNIECMKYVSIEKYDNNNYTVVNYMFEDDTYIVELSFWTINTSKEIIDLLLASHEASFILQIKVKKSVNKQTF